MGLIKEYVDKSVQTETDTALSLYADPAVVLAAPPVAHREAHARPYNPTSELSPASDSIPKSPASPVLAPLVSRRLSNRKLPRYPAGEIVNRRIASMPENPSEALSVVFDGHGKRVVSMPDRVRPVLEPSVELFQSPSTAAGDSFGSYTGRRERVRVFPTPSDIPQTPSPPSSPESLLIIAAGTQLPEGFLRRKYSPEPFIEEDEDWITWADSPPRPIPALHGPLSLPYARCPSGAEGTIIEESDNVAQMIWGLGPDDQPHNQIRTEGLSSHHDYSQNFPSQGSSQVPPRLQKKKTAIQQIPKLSRTQNSAHPNYAKPGIARTQRQAFDDRRSLQVSSDIETHQDTINRFPWNEGQSMPATTGVPDNLVNDSDVFPVDSNTLEWQLARLRHALSNSLGDMDPYSTYPGRLEPVIPAAVAPGFPQSYPRIFVEPRPNESVGPASRQSPIELAQQYRQLQLYGQALQKQKMQIQSILPTPPNSSSPQWSSQFSPYLTYCSTFSPELVGSTEHPISVPSQKFRSGANASHHLRRVYDQHENVNVNDFDTNIQSAKTPQTAPNVNSAASFRHSPSSSSTLAKYIKQLQALSPIARFPPLQPVPPPNVPLPPLPSTDESNVGHFRSSHHSSTVPTPPSPESPQALSRGSYYNTRSMPLTRPMQMQRRLSSVPEEDSAVLELSTFVSPSKLEHQVTNDNSSSSHDGMGHHIRHPEVPLADVPRKITLPESESSLGAPPIAFHETSPVKVRLPVNKELNIREQASGQGHQHGPKRKYRYKKLKGVATSEQVPTRGIAG